MDGVCSMGEWPTVLPTHNTVKKHKRENQTEGNVLLAVARG